MSFVEQQTAVDRQARKLARAELVGSMIRPPELIDAFKQVFPDRSSLGRYPRGQGTDDARRDLDAAVEAALADLIKRQDESGIDILVNGEFARMAWWMSLFGALQGFAMDRQSLVARDGHGDTTTIFMPSINQEVRRVANPAADEARMLTRLTDRPFKITFRAASYDLIFWGRPVVGPEVYDARLYDSPQQALDALLAVERDLVDEVVDIGTPYVQFDYPVYPHLVDESWMKVYRDGGVKDSALIDLALRLDNAMVARLPSHVTTALHMCRGNVGNKFVARGALDTIAEQVFTELQYDRLLIEWSEPERHGGFDALRFVQPGTTVVLGIIDSKSRTVESESEVLRKIEEAARFIDIQQLAISPQCGFSSAVGLNDAVDVQWRKIDVLCRVADKVWGRC